MFGENEKVAILVENDKALVKLDRCTIDFFFFFGPYKRREEFELITFAL